ncbi:energy transducer TonB [Massilia consociata]|uniref:Protein TonB n=1 Tax=Massilia consociata TaxID=760117 RepID=A0ABV6FL21_9BURK
MHFSQLNDGTGGKAGKFALVAGLHVLVAMGVMNAMHAKSIQLPALLEEPIAWIKPEVPPPPPPPQPPQPQARAVEPTIAVPAPEIDTPLPPMEETIQASTEPEPMPEPAQPARSEAPPAPPTPAGNASPGQMRSAVLADANSCAKPDYPVSAARNGDSGTVTLALMVGPDGRVQDARIQRSSGHRDLDRAAVNALSLCQFKPAMNNGIAEASWAQIAYVWTLE